MGLAASQSRFLTLTARQNDLEYQAQQLSNSKLQLSAQLEQIAQEYTAGIAKRSLFVNEANGTNMYSATSMNPIYYQVNTATLARNGYQVMVVGKNILYNNYTPAAGEIKKGLEDGIRDGTYVLLKVADSSDSSFMTKVSGIPGLTGEYQQIDWRTQSDVCDLLDSASGSNADTIYDAKTSEIQEKDKKLTLESQRIETQHKAVEAELEAIQKIIKSNSDSSFKTFTAYKLRNYW